MTDPHASPPPASTQSVGNNLALSPSDIANVVHTIHMQWAAAAFGDHHATLKMAPDAWDSSTVTGALRRFYGADGACSEASQPGIADHRSRRNDQDHPGISGGFGN